MTNTGPAIALALPTRAEAPRPAGASSRAYADASPSQERRKAPAATRVIVVEDRRGGRADARFGSGNATFFAHSFAQARWPVPEPKTTHENAVARYPSLTLLAEVVTSGEGALLLPAVNGHLVDLSV